jgi:hypothetical protein
MNRSWTVNHTAKDHPHFIPDEGTASRYWHPELGPKALRQANTHLMSRVDDLGLEEALESCNLRSVKSAFILLHNNWIIMECIGTLIGAVKTSINYDRYNCGLTVRQNTPVNYIHSGRLTVRSAQSESPPPIQWCRTSKQPTVVLASGIMLANKCVLVCKMSADPLVESIYRAHPDSCLCVCVCVCVYVKAKNQA